MHAFRGSRRQERPKARKLSDGAADPKGPQIQPPCSMFSPPPPPFAINEKKEWQPTLPAPRTTHRTPTRSMGWVLRTIGWKSVCMETTACHSVGQKRGGERGRSHGAGIRTGRHKKRKVYSPPPGPGTPLLRRLAFAHESRVHRKKLGMRKEPCGRVLKNGLWVLWPSFSVSAAR